MLKTLTIFIASFRKQSGRRMRKYGLVQPTDKQSGPYDDHHDFDPWHFWMLMNDDLDLVLSSFLSFIDLSFLIHSPLPSMVKWFQE